MIGETTSLFKVFRVLWFPMSINAMVLGAAAVALFWVGSWVFAWAAGVPESMEDLPGRLEVTVADRADSLTEHFFPKLLDVVQTRSWPESGRFDHTDHLGWVFGGQIILFFFLWSTFGVAICRVLALRVARDEYCALGSAFSFAWRVKLTGMLYPLAVVLPILVLLMGNQVVGWFTWIPGVGWLVGVLLMPLVIVSSLLAVFIGLAGIVSLGFMPAAIATERKGTYDSLGKSFNYVFARAIPLILHLVVLWLFLSIIHDLLIDRRLVENVLADTMGPVWTGDDSTFVPMIMGQDDLGGFEGVCAWLYGVVLGLYRLLVWGALISFTLGAFTSLFLILRKDVDGMDYIDVARDPSDAPDPVPSSAPPPQTEGEGEEPAPSDSDGAPSE